MLHCRNGNPNANKASRKDIELEIEAAYLVQRLRDGKCLTDHAMFYNRQLQPSLIAPELPSLPLLQRFHVLPSEPNYTTPDGSVQLGKCRKGNQAFRCPRGKLDIT